MQITCSIHPTPSSPPVSPSASPMPSSSPETAPPTPPCIPTSAPCCLSWHDPNLLLSLPHVKFYVSFYFSLHQRPHLLENTRCAVNQILKSVVRNICMLHS